MRTGWAATYLAKSPDERGAGNAGKNRAPGLAQRTEIFVTAKPRIRSLELAAKAAELA